MKEPKFVKGDVVAVIPSSPFDPIRRGEVGRITPSGIVVLITGERFSSSGKLLGYSGGAYSRPYIRKWVESDQVRHERNVAWRLLEEAMVKAKDRQRSTVFVAPKDAERIREATKLVDALFGVTTEGGAR